MEISESLKNADFLKGWEICEEIGRGGSGIVYRVRSLRTGEYAALKWIRIRHDSRTGEDAFKESQRRIRNEISTLRRLSDNGLVVAIQASSEFSCDDGREWNTLIRMECLTPLLEYLGKEAFTLKMVVDLACDVASALGQCHRLNLVHGDIKPENVLVGEKVYKLADFGIATALDDLKLRQAEAGTRAYQPPEYSLGSRPTYQGDVYSLGIMLYCILNEGLMPFQDGYTDEDLMRAVEERRLSAENADFSFYALPRFAPVVLGNVICKACAPDPEDRFRNGDDFAAALTEAQSQISQTEAAATVRYPGKPFASTSGMLRPGNVPTDNLLNSSDASKETKEQKDDGSGSQTEDSPSEAGPRLPRPVSNPITPKDAPVSIQERLRRIFANKWVRLACAAIAVIAIIFGAIHYIASRPVPPLQAEIIPSAFSADIVSADGRGDLLLYPSAQPGAVQTVAHSALPVTVDNLAPSTEYILSDGNRQAAFVTPDANNGIWARGESVIYTISRAELESILEYGNIDLIRFARDRGTPAGNSITLENQARQGTRAFLVCAAEYLNEVPADEVSMMTVLRLENGEIYMSSQTVTFSDNSCVFLAEITDLFEQRFAASGSQFYGKAALELYVEGGQAGYLDIMIESKL